MKIGCKILGIAVVAFIMQSSVVWAQMTSASALPSAPVVDGHMAVTQTPDPNYILATNDYIQVMVYQEDDLTTTTRVSPTGIIALPLIGSIKVGGMRIADANEFIRDKFMDGYIRNPHVSITVVEFAPRRFSVLGQVQKPGTYEMPQQESVTLLDAIALAAGYTPIANPSSVTVRRNTNGKEKIFRLDAKVMARDSSHAQFYIEPGDVVTIAESIF